MSVKISKLPNGLHIVTDAMDTVETASIGAWVGIGARHERPEINGITHVLEHMAFKGTKRRSPQAIVEGDRQIFGTPAVSHDLGSRHEAPAAIERQLDLATEVEGAHVVHPEVRLPDRVVAEDAPEIARTGAPRRRQHVSLAAHACRGEVLASHAGSANQALEQPSHPLRRRLAGLSRPDRRL